MNPKEDKDGDLKRSCIFFPRTVQGSVEKEYFNEILKTQTPTENYKFALALAFTLDEINRNPDLLPNKTLVFDYHGHKYVTISEIYNLIQLIRQKSDESPNYYCVKDNICQMMITGPYWELSIFLVAFIRLYKAQQLNSLLKKTHFSNPVGDRVNMNPKEELQEEYDIFQIWDFPHGLRFKVKVGKYSAYFPRGQQLHVYEDMIEWATGNGQMPSSVCSADCGPGSRKFWQEGMAVCCFQCRPCPENEISNDTNVDQCMKCPEDQFANREQNQCMYKDVTFLSYEDPLGMALASMSSLFCAFTALVLVVFVKHHDTPIVKANNRKLSYILLISLFFCFLCPLLFIGHPNSVTCILQQITFGVVFTVAVSTVLAKTVTVLLAFKVTTPGRRMRYFLVSGAPNYIIPICTVIQVIICSVWLGVSPPSVNIDAHTLHGHIIIVCSKGSVTAFYCVLGYLGCLAQGSFTVAFLSRNLPNTFNEAKYLTFSMLLFCCVWVTFLPVYHSTQGKVMVAVEIFSILASSSGMLGCIFFPKCYIILLRQPRHISPNYQAKVIFQN